MKKTLLSRLATALQHRMRRATHALKVITYEKQVQLRTHQHPERQPIVFFNASTRLGSFSQNAAFSQLTAWAVRMQGVPVVHFVCKQGMSRCVLGTDQNNVQAKMPCRTCVQQSRILYGDNPDTVWFSYQEAASLKASLEKLSLDELMGYEHPTPAGWGLGVPKIPLGALVLPAIRWRLRLHNLTDDDNTRFLYREFMLSAWNVAEQFAPVLQEKEPQAAVIFNGQFFPEATARWLCQQRGIKVITHEVGIRPLTAYFTPGEATAYPIDIPETFALTEEQNARLDAYLENRMQGNFSMAGIQFWPQMKGLDKDFLEKASQFQQIVPIFTNVIFDTSQPHSNVVFSDMFAWLDVVLEFIKENPDTLFVIRAHPDEGRPGKAAVESVADWVAKNRADQYANLVFVPSGEFISSYELIQCSKFVMIYNSTIGLEASIMGKAVLCAGKARFTQYPTVTFPKDVQAYRSQLQQFLTAAQIEVPEAHRRYARQFLYYQLYFTSLPFEQFLSPGENLSAVWLNEFNLDDLHPDRSPTVRAIWDGLHASGDFLLLEKDLK